VTVLRGLRVVEVSASGAAAMAAKQLADWGAEVTILEPAGGTPLRSQPPFYDAGGERKSATWKWLSRGKRALEVNPATAVRPEAALDYAQRADVVLAETELTESVFGVPPAGMRAAFEGRTTCVLIAPFATDGPYERYRASDLGIAALGGWANIIGDPGREPLRPGGEMIARVTGVCAFVAALLALRSRRLDGGPQFVDLSGQAVAASAIVAPWLVKPMLGIEQNRRANDWLQGGVMECSDGWLGCTPLTATHWEMMCHMLGLDDVLERPEGHDPMWRWEHSAELLERARPYLENASKFDLFRQAQEWRIPAAPVEDVAERLACPHLEARGFFVRASIDGREVKVPRVAFSIDVAQPTPRGELARLDELPVAHPLREHLPPSSRRPFEGIRVVDLTHFWAGPYATSLLGAMGADVIKVESVQRPDAYRLTFAPGALDRWYERSPLWQDTNCNKRGLTLDLTSAEGRELFERLLAISDVVVNNFSNRVMRNLGYPDARLHEINPRLIVTSIPGYGPGGPWEDYVGFGIAFEQLAIAASITGYPDGVPRIMSGFCDPLAGLHAVAAIELALIERERTGRGAVVEVPQCEVLDSLFAPEDIAVQMGAPVPGRRGNLHEWMAPHNTYPVAGDDRWISIAVASDEEFAALCRVLRREEMTHDSRFASAAARKEHEKELDSAIAAAVAGRDGADLEGRLQEVGVMACRVAKGFELPGDANLRHIGFFQPVTRELTGTHPYKTWPFRFSGFQSGHVLPPPMLGEHNREVLVGLLGLGEADLAALEDRKVIGTVPVGIEG
jgi:crotonobetainyl-CoA:carnitine CoA-transferase CaiB-like acyl-CoA transferase